VIFLLLCLLTFNCPADAKSLRIVHLSEGEMEPVFVEPGFSTLLKFDSHPEPGLIGDQDGFKVEYMKNMVAIKPLVSKGKTNLFLFTKDGQFNFQLVAGKGRHDNIVYVQAGASQSHGSQPKLAVLIDDLLTRKLGKVVVSGGTKLILESIATPVSRSTVVLKISVEQRQSVDAKSFTIRDGKKVIPVENVFLESRVGPSSITVTSGLILIRAQEIKKGALRLEFSQPGMKRAISIPFSADFRRR
jgi:hypothetical protein